MSPSCSRTVSPSTVPKASPPSWMMRAQSVMNSPCWSLVDLEPSRGQCVSAGCAVDEVDVTALRNRRHDAGHDGRRLPVQAEARDLVELRLREPLLDSIGERGRAIERHAKVVVELAEVRVFDHLAPKDRGIETADPNAETHDHESEQRARA